jgi:hypothetical protein
MLNIPKDFREFIQFLNENNVRYLLVGGYAVAYHGHPRSTGDIDFFIDCQKDNARFLIRALESFGFSELGLTLEDFSTKDNVIQLGYPPLRIDILTSIDGVEFKEAWKNRLTITIQDLSINIIGLQDLLTNKHVSSRKIDKADEEALT